MPAILLCAGSLAAISGCRQAAEPPLAGARIGGPFALVDQDGRTVTDRDFAGKWRAVYFGYTYCPDVCPTDVQTLMQAYRGFAEASPALAAKLRPIFITVDPARDTPAVLKQFVDAFGTGLTGLTGSDAQIADVAKRYGVSFKKRPPEGTGGYLVDHLRTTVLFDPNGAPIALLPTDQGKDAVVNELDRWIR